MRKTSKFMKCVADVNPMEFPQRLTSVWTLLARLHAKAGKATATAPAKHKPCTRGARSRATYADQVSWRRHFRSSPSL